LKSGLCLLFACCIRLFRQAASCWLLVVGCEERLPATSHFSKGE
jgi:hypothetical protein